MKNLGSVLALYPTPLVVVGTFTEGKPTWTLVGHLGIMGHDHIMISLAKPHYINGSILENGILSVHAPKSVIAKVEFFIFFIAHQALGF